MSAMSIALPANTFMITRSSAEQVSNTASGVYAYDVARLTLSSSNEKAARAASNGTPLLA